MSGKTHHWLHDINGAAWHDGLTLSGYTEATDSDAALTFELTNGVYFDEDLEHTIIDGAPATQYSQQLNGGDASIPIVYKNATGVWVEDAASTLPYKLISAGNRLAFNRDDGGGNWSQVEVADGKWVSMTIIATNDWQYPIKAIQGQNQYTDKKTAVEEATAEIISFGGGTLSPEVITLYRFVMQTKDTFSGTKKAKIETDGVTDFRGSQILGEAAAASDHGTLSGLADDDHAQYVKDSEFTADSEILVGTGSGTFQKESGATLRTSIGTYSTAQTDTAIDNDIATHAGLSDPHTGYRLESADHTHQTTGAQAGKLDHGAALDGLGDDDHTQYTKHSLATAVSDFLVASGVGVFVKKTLAETLGIISPLTTRGDIMFRNATVSTRLAKGAANTVLVMGANDPAWSAILAGLTLTSPTINGTIGTTGLTLPAFTAGGLINANGYIDMATGTSIRNSLTTGGHWFGLTARDVDGSAWVALARVINANDPYIDFGTAGGALKIYGSNKIELQNTLTLNSQAFDAGSGYCEINTTGKVGLLMDGGITSGGVAASNCLQNYFGGNFVSGGVGNHAAKLFVGGELLGFENDTGTLSIVRLFGSVKTQDSADDVISVVSQLWLREPTITVQGSTTIAVAATLYIDGAPTEGVTDASIYVASGDTNLATLTMRGVLAMGANSITLDANETVDGIDVSSLDSAVVKKATLTTKGDLYVATGASTVVRIGVGTDTHVLTADSGETPGIKWAEAAGGGAATKEFFVPVTHVDNASGDFYGDYPVGQCTTNGQHTYMAFCVPQDFSSITEAVVVILSNTNETDADIDIFSDYAANDEAYNTHSESDTASVYQLTGNRWFEVDISGILSSLATGDYVGIMCDMGSDFGTLRVLGVRFKYA
ncbi:hypothetical protein LCGC14_1210210 [marine sediment metagenome]|uniref:Uncharacterized protein n=1 Tax=marine sediment metagenome TaxID=412755 RepID=A0A0F9LIK3_9ZZZZ